MPNTTVLKASKKDVVEADWGTLTWFASRKLGNSEEMTIGKCVLKPGAENPRHQHPNCEEVLVVLQGKISHEIENGKEVILEEGDTITLPQGLAHKAKNIGEKDAILHISFSSADREVIGE